MRNIIYVILLIHAYQLQAQEDDLRQVIRKTFFDKRIYDKIFFEYKGQDGITFMEGHKKGMKGAFVLPDTTLQNKIPNLLELVGTSHATEKYFMTITLLSDPMGNVFITSNILDTGILLWINFDMIKIERKNACLKFFTTSLDEKESLKDKYIKVECILKKRNGSWKVKSVKIENSKYVDLFP